MRMTSWITRAGIALFAAIAAVAAVPGHAQTLRFGLAEDPDVLDPTLARTFVGRIVFAALCDKLFDVDEKLNIVPQLATSYEWSADRKALTLKLRRGVTFPRRREVRRRGGEVQHRAPQDHGRLQSPRRARARRERRRRGRIHRATEPVGAFLAAPGGARRSRGDDGLAEGGAGRGRQVRRQARVLGAVPLRRARRAGQDRARALPELLEQGRDPSRPGHLSADRRLDGAPRQFALGTARHHRAHGRSDVPSLKTDSRFKVARITEIGYQGITINVGKSDLSQKNPLGKDARVREAFELALDRDGYRAGRDGWRGRRGQSVGRSHQRVLLQERSYPQARRRPRQGPAGARQACPIRASRW